jgi:hypothetical protein
VDGWANGLEDSLRSTMRMVRPHRSIRPHAYRIDPRSGLPVETVGCDGRSGSLYTVGDGRGDAIVSALDRK